MIKNSISAQDFHNIIKNTSGSEDSIAAWQELNKSSKKKDYNIKEFTEDYYRARKDAYSQQVEYVDNVLGDFFDFLTEKGITENTIIVLYANHGDSLGDNNILTHGVSYQSCVHIPLLIRHPKIKKPVLIKKPVFLIDLVPTIYDMLGIDVDYDVSGVSLIPLIEGRRYERKYVYGKSKQTEYIISGKWKLISIGSMRKRLYNIAKDPYEQYNLLHRYPKIARELEAEIRLKKIELLKSKTDK